MSTGAPVAVARSLAFPDARNGTAAATIPAPPTAAVVSVRNLRRPGSTPGLLSTKGLFQDVYTLSRAFAGPAQGTAPPKPGKYNGQSPVSVNTCGPMLLRARRNGCVVQVSRPRSAAKRTTSRSEEHTSELQSLMRISYAVFCLTKKIKQNNHKTHLIT